MDDVDPPPDPRHQKEYHFLSEEDRKLIQERIATTNVQSAYYIAINTGVRVSECFALRWSDIDFEHRRVAINKQLRFEDKKWCFTPLKTPSSYRSIEVTQTFLDYLKALKLKQNESRRFYGDAYNSENYVWDRREKNQDEKIAVPDFINIKQNGAMLTSDSEKFMARIIRNDCGIPFKFHNLRHTYATILAENGAHPKYVQAQLGHSKFEFTLRYYTHVTDKMGQQAMAVLESEIGVPFTIEDPNEEKHGRMREGILIPSMSGDKIDVRFGSEDYYGGLSDGESMDVWMDNHWIKAKLENSCSGWMLVGIKTDFIFGLKVRI